jgi:hypothetical protein
MTQQREKWTEILATSNNPFFWKEQIDFLLDLLTQTDQAAREGEREKILAALDFKVGDLRKTISVPKIRKILAPRT